MFIMTLVIAVTAIGQQILATQAKWSAAQRRRRAVEGRRRSAEFLALLGPEIVAPDHWAIGSPSLPDMDRIAD